MAEKKVKIVAECVCDLPQKLLDKYDIDIVHFEITTENGVFTDREEITARNVFEYISNGGKKARSSAPPPAVYREAFERCLADHDEIVLVAISSKVSESCLNAGLAAGEMGEDQARIHIFDSEHLSTGLGFMVLRAGQLAMAGEGTDTILRELAAMRPLVSTSFITMDAEYLYRSEKVSKRVRDLCSALSIHPVLAMKDGAIVLKSVEFGDFKRACRRYIRKSLKNTGQIDKVMGFITHAECSWNMIQSIRDEAMGILRFETLMVTNASATVSSNCGPNTMGIIFMRDVSGTKWTDVDPGKGGQS